MSTVLDLPLGARLTRLRRALFVLGADLTGDSGDLELSFDNRQVFLFGVAGNGEDLTIEPNIWRTQFPEPVSPENQQFLWASGKWEILDLGETLWSYRQFLGRKLCGVEGQGTNGIILNFDGSLIRIEVVADELHVHFTR